MLIDDLSILKYNSKLNKQLILKKPSNEPVGILENSFDESLETDIIGVNRFSFKIHSKEHYAKDIKVGKFLHFKIEQEEKVDDGFGGFEKPLFYEEMFYITGVERNEGEEEFFEVSTKSNYGILGSKIVQGYSGIGKRLYRTDFELALFPSGPEESGVVYDTFEEFENSGILNYIMKLIPDWELDYVSSAVGELHREVDFLENSVLEILTTFLPENFGAIVQFDTIEKKISVYGIDELGEDEGLIIQSDQIAKNIKTNTLDSEWVTKMYVYGADGLTISPVNPTGDDYLIKLDYVMLEEFMSEGLINGINNQKSYIEDETSTLEEYFLDLAPYQSALNDLEDEKNGIENTIEDLKTELDSTIIRYANSESTPSRTTSQIISEINDEQKKLGNSYTETGVLTEDGADFFSLTESYVSNLKVWLMNNNYPELAVEGADYEFNGSPVTGIDTVAFQRIVVTYEAEFGFETIETQMRDIQTQIDNIFDSIFALKESFQIYNFINATEEKELQFFIREKVYRNDNITERDELYAKGQEVLAKINSPQVEIIVDAADFLNSMKYSTQWDKVKLGNKVTVNAPSLVDKSIKMRIVGYTWDFNDGKVKIVLSSTNKKNDSTFELEELLNNANNTSTSISINSSKYGAYVESGERNDLMDYINNNLDLAAQGARLVGENQDWTIDERGILLSNVVDDGRKIRIMNNMLVLTSDGFETADVAITPNGVVAERLIGKVIIGTELILQSEDGVSFIFDENGVRINGGSLVITHTDPETGEVLNYDTLDDLLLEINDDLAEFSSDLVITRDEATEIKRLMSSLDMESKAIIDRAAILEVSNTAYANSINNMKGELSPYISTDLMPLNYPIEISTLQRKQINDLFDIVQDEKSKLNVAMNEEVAANAEEGIQQSYDDLNDILDGLELELENSMSDNWITQSEASALELSLDQIIWESINIIETAQEILEYNLLDLEIGDRPPSGYLQTSKSEYEESIGTLQNELNRIITAPPMDYPLELQNGEYDLITGAFTDLQNKKSILNNDITKYLDSINNARYSELGSTISLLGDDISGFTSDLKVTKKEADSWKTALGFIDIHDDELQSMAADLDIGDELTDYNAAFNTLIGVLDPYIERELPFPVYPVSITAGQRDVIFAAFTAYKNAKAVLTRQISLVDIEDTALVIGRVYNNFSFTAENGAVVTTNTELTKTTMNATSGFKIENRDTTSSAWGTAFEVNPAGDLYADGTITARELIIGGVDVLSSIGELSQINADLGDITAGSITGITITGGTFKTSSSGARIEISNDDLKTYNSSGQLEGIQISADNNFNNLELFNSGVYAASLSYAPDFNYFTLANSSGDVGIASSEDIYIGADGFVRIRAEGGDIDLDTILNYKATVNGNEILTTASQVTAKFG